MQTQHYISISKARFPDAFDETGIVPKEAFAEWFEFLKRAYIFNTSATSLPVGLVTTAEDTNCLYVPYTGVVTSLSGVTAEEIPGGELEKAKGGVDQVNLKEAFYINNEGERNDARRFESEDTFDEKAYVIFANSRVSHIGGGLDNHMAADGGGESSEKEDANGLEDAVVPVPVAAAAVPK